MRGKLDASTILQEHLLATLINLAMCDDSRLLWIRDMTPQGH